MRRLLFQATWHLHRLAYRLFGRRAAGARTLDLRTGGRRSGAPRSTLPWLLEDGARRAVVASNPGDERDPGLLLNLRAEPATLIVVDGREERVVAREAHADDRAALWQLIVEWNPVYADYARRTPREVSVVVLEPAA